MSTPRPSSAVNLYNTLARYMIPLIKSANKSAENFKTWSSPTKLPAKSGEKKPDNWKDKEEQELEKLKKYGELINDFETLYHKYHKEIKSGRIESYQDSREKFVRFMERFQKISRDTQIGTLFDKLFATQKYKNSDFAMGVQLLQDVMMSLNPIKPTEEDMSTLKEQQKILKELQLQFGKIFKDLRTLRPQPELQPKVPQSPATPPRGAGAAGAGPLVARSPGIESKRRAESIEEQHRKHIAALEREHYLKEARLNEEFEKNMSGLRAELQKLQALLTASRSKFADQEQNVAELQAELKKAGEGAQAKRSQEAMLMAHRAFLMKLLADHKGDISSKIRTKYERELFSIDQILENLVKDLAELSKRVSELERELDKAKKEADHWKQQAQQLQQRSIQLDREKQELQSSLDALRKAHASEIANVKDQHAAAMSGLRAEFITVQMSSARELQRAQEQYASERETLERTVAALNKKIEDLQTSEHDLKARIDSLGSDLKRNGEQKQKQVQELEKLRIELRQKITDINEFRSSLEIAKQDKTHLEKRIKDLEEALARERAVYLDQLTKLSASVSASGGDRVAKISAAYEETVKNLKQEIQKFRQESINKRTTIQRLSADLNTAVRERQTLQEGRVQLLADQKNLIEENNHLQDQWNYWEKEARQLQDYANALHEQHDREIKKLRKNMAEAESRAKFEAKRTAELEHERAGLRENLSKKQKELEGLGARAHELDITRQRLERDLKRHGEDYVSLENNYTIARRQLVENNETILRLEAELSQQKQLVIQLRGQGGDVKGVEDQIQILTKQLLKERARSQELEEQGRSFLFDLERTRRESDALKQENSDLANAKKTLSTQMEKLREENRELVHRLEESEGKLRREQMAFSEKIKDLSAHHEREIKRFQETITDKEQAILEQRRRTVELKQEKQDFERELRRVQTELERMTKSYNGAMEDVQRLQRMVTELRNNISDHEKTISGLKNTIASNQQEIDQLRHKEHALGEQLKDLTSDLKRKDERIIGVGRELEAEKQQHDKTLAEVRRLQLELAKFTTSSTATTATSGAPDQGKGTVEPKRKHDIPQDDVKSGDEALQSLRNQLQAAKDQLAASATTIQKLNGDKQELTAAKRKAEQEKIDLEIRNGNLTQERDALQRENERIQGQLAEKLENVGKLQKELQDQMRLNKEAERKLQHEGSQNAMLRNDNTRIQEQLDSINGELDAVRQELSETQAERDALRGEVTELRGKNQDIANALRALQKRNGEWEQYARGLERKNEQLTTQFTTAQDALAELEQVRTDKERYRRERNATRRERDAAKQEIMNQRSGLQAVIQNIAGERDEARGERDEARNALEAERGAHADVLARLAAAEKALDGERRQREDAQAERDAIRTERDTARGDRAAAIAERDAIRSERDAARGERDAARLEVARIEAERVRELAAAQNALQVVRKEADDAAAWVRLSRQGKGGPSDAPKIPGLK